jgi:hypothetical protein
MGTTELTLITRPRSVAGTDGKARAALARQADAPSSRMGAGRAPPRSRSSERFLHRSLGTRAARGRLGSFELRI